MQHICTPSISSFLRTVRRIVQASPYGPSIGLVHGVFGLKFSPGPEPKPWDTLKGYSTVNGITKVKGTTFADFEGSSGCGVSSIAQRTSYCWLRHHSHVLPDLPEHKPGYTSASFLAQLQSQAELLAQSCFACHSMSALYWSLLPPASGRLLRSWQPQPRPRCLSPCVLGNLKCGQRG
jgi:hypothetical protein